MATRTIDAATLRTQVAGIFERLDVPSDDAGIVAHHLVEADLRGVHSHGVIRVPTYATGLKAGRINPRPNLEVVEDHGGQVVMDGDFGLGQLTAFRANELAIQRGKEHGLAAVALRRSTHCGAMAYYAIRAREQGLIGLAITNAGMNMTPTGGTAKIIGNNPFAMAVPTTRECPKVSTRCSGDLVRDCNRYPSTVSPTFGRTAAVIGQRSFRQLTAGAVTAKSAGKTNARTKSICPHVVLALIRTLAIIEQRLLGDRNVANGDRPPGIPDQDKS